MVVLVVGSSENGWILPGRFNGVYIWCVEWWMDWTRGRW